MFAFNDSNNEGKINLNPIYQSIGALNEDKLDKTEYAGLFDGLLLDTQKKLSNYLDRTREQYFMDAYNWTKSTDEFTPFNSGYFVAKSEQNEGAELFTTLNYNYNVNYIEAFNVIVNAALNDSNTYKNRIELTGNLNFSESLLFDNEAIKTIVLKNKNINNTFDGMFVNPYNRLINIDGFNVANLNIAATPGFIKIKNCDVLVNLNCESVNNIIIENIGVISDDGFFKDIENLKLNDVSFTINNNFYFSNIKNLVINNATIEGSRANMFSKISNAIFNNVNFYLETLNSRSAAFNNSIVENLKFLNSFNFINCSFNDGSGVFLVE